MKNQPQPFEIAVTHTGTIDPEEFLTTVVECSGDAYDTAGFDGHAVTIDGTATLSQLAHIILRIRLAFWDRVEVQKIGA